MPTKLNLLERPYVLFDVNNRLHRKYFASFLATGSWRHVPVRFICDQETADNVPAMIKDFIADYYLQKEFKDSDWS